MYNSKSGCASRLPAADQTATSSNTRRSLTGFEQFGGYNNAKEQKLVEQQLVEAAGGGGGPRIFHGISIHVNGYTRPSRDELRRLVVAHGGRYVHFFSKSKVTHMVAENLPLSKVNKLTSRDKVVHPRWLTDSVACGRLLHSAPYLLYSPEGVKQDVGSLPVPLGGRAGAKPQPNSINVEPERLVDAAADDHSHGAHHEQGANQTRKRKSDALTGAEPSSHEAAASTRLDTPKKVPARTSLVSKAGDKNFLQEFYSNSRLHHISTWGAEFKQLVSKLQTCPPDNPVDLSAEGTRDALDDALADINHRCCGGQCWSGKGSDTVVVHVDLDCFFVSVGLLRHPQLKGQPVAVTHSRGRGVPSGGGGSGGGSADQFESYAEIASCSYEARALGVKNGMLMGRARALCPQLRTIPYDFEGYYRTAVALYNCVARYSTAIQAVSCDECVVDVATCVRDSQLTACQVCALIARDVFRETGCRVSAGISSNLLLSRICIKRAKPNGLFSVDGDDPVSVGALLDPLPVRELPGVGHSTAHQLHTQGINTVQQLREKSLVELQSLTGAKTGQSLYNMARGVDRRQLSSATERKSVSAEVNYGIRLETSAEVVAFLHELAGEVHRRLVECDMLAKSVTVKLKVRAAGEPRESIKFMGHGICDNMSKSKKLSSHTNSLPLLKSECASLYAKFSVPPCDVRGIGITLQKLLPATQRLPQSNTDISTMLSRNKKSASLKSCRASPRSKEHPAKPPPDKLWDKAAQLEFSYDPDPPSTPNDKHDAASSAGQSHHSVTSDPGQMSPAEEVEAMNMESVHVLNAPTDGVSRQERAAPSGKMLFAAPTGAAGEHDAYRTAGDDGTYDLTLVVPSLGPATSPQQVAQLLTEWTSVAHEVDREDIDILLDYSMRLLSARHFRNLTLFMRKLRRLALNKNSCCWTEAFNKIYLEIQQNSRYLYDVNINI